jgi:hypothetical protein
MKKIIKSSVLFLGACFFAGAVNAQLASDKPALTAQQMADIIQKGKADAAKSATTTSPTVSVSSDKPAITTQQHHQLMIRGTSEIKMEPAKTISTPAKIPNQGDTKEVISQPAAETKTPTPPVPSEKPVAVKQ